MTIEFRCACGKMLSVPDDAAGRKAKCPNCGALRDVPGEPPPVAPSVEPESIGGLRVDAPPQLVALAAVMAGTAFGVLALTLIAAVAMSQWIAWLFVWVPQAVLGGFAAFWLTQANPLAKKTLSMGAPVLIGVNYVTFWWAVQMLTQHGAEGLLCMLPAMIQLSVYAFLYWYFRRDEVETLFGAADVVADDASPVE